VVLSVTIHTPESYAGGIFGGVFWGVLKTVDKKVGTLHGQIIVSFIVATNVDSSRNTEP
jgi:hypothetical protein